MTFVRTIIKSDQHEDMNHSYKPFHETHVAASHMHHLAESKYDVVKWRMSQNDIASTITASWYQELSLLIMLANFEIAIRNFPYSGKK